MTTVPRIAEGTLTEIDAGVMLREFRATDLYLY